MCWVHNYSLLLTGTTDCSKSKNSKQISSLMETYKQRFKQWFNFMNFPLKIKCSESLNGYYDEREGGDGCGLVYKKTRDANGKI